MTNEKPRLFQSSRDIIISLGVLLIIMVVAVVPTGLCSFNPGGSDKFQVGEPVDVDRILQMDAAAMPFPVRNPEVPDSWVASIASRLAVAQSQGVNVGWVVEEQDFVQLIQSDAPLEEGGSTLQGKSRQPDGTFELEGKTWTIFSAEDEQTVWGTDLGDVRIYILGRSSDDIKKQLAHSVMIATPLDPAAEAHGVQS